MNKAWLLVLLVLTTPAQALDRATLASQICAAAETEAAANNIDANFFARLLWRESLFDPNVVSDAGAQGIAQFMPDTAKRRGLIDPFEPLSAVKASAAFIADLRKQFGNLGLAAAAYNAGERRVSDWQAGNGGMPDETRNYVLFITGKEVDDWKGAADEVAVPSIGKEKNFAANCMALALRKGQLAGTHLRSAARQPWGALLAAGFNESRTVAIFKRLNLRFPDLIAKRERMVFVMLGEKTQSSAAALCEKLNNAGAPCVVRKN